MFTINGGYIYNTVCFEHDSTKVEVDSFKRDDHKGQAEFVISVLNSLYHLTTGEADDLIRNELCKKYNLVDPEKNND